jgi:SAM-dependent methyltransferase
MQLIESIPTGWVEGKLVLECGSLDVNGSPRRYLEDLNPESYIGVDVLEGPGVDMVMDAVNIPDKFPEGIFDLVVSTEVLEHCPDWKGVVHSMKYILKEGGYIVVTARGPGMGYHPHEHDCWRFTVDDFHHIFSDMDIILLEEDTMVPGVLLKARKRVGFVEKDLKDYSVMKVEQP